MLKITVSNKITTASFDGGPSFELHGGADHTVARDVVALAETNGVTEAQVVGSDDIAEALRVAGVEIVESQMLERPWIRDWFSDDEIATAFCEIMEEAGELTPQMKDRIRRVAIAIKQRRDRAEVVNDGRNSVHVSIG